MQSETVDRYIKDGKIKPDLSVPFGDKRMFHYNAGATYEADRILKELPETLEVRKSRDCLMMNMEEAQKFFGITFKKPLFPWLSKIFA